MFQQLPSRMRQFCDEGATFGLGETFHGIHKMHVRPASLQQRDKVFAQRTIIVACSVLLVWHPFCFFLHSDSYVSETSTCCGTSGTGCKVVLTKPAFPNIFPYCAKV